MPLPKPSSVQPGTRRLFLSSSLSSSRCSKRLPLCSNIRVGTATTSRPDFQPIAAKMQRATVAGATFLPRRMNSRIVGPTGTCHTQPGKLQLLAAASIRRQICESKCRDRYALHCRVALLMCSSGKFPKSIQLLRCKHCKPHHARA